MSSISEENHTMKPSEAEEGHIMELLDNPPPTLLEKRYMVELLGDYYPAIGLALHYLLEVQASRVEENSSAKKYKRKPKITNADIDEILSFSFGKSQRYFSNIRQCYCNGRSIEDVKKVKKQCFNFSPKNMKDYCEKHGIELSPSTLQTILLLSNLALPISDILNGSYIVPLHKDIKSTVKSEISILKPIFKNHSDILYWKSFFKYFPSITTNGEIMLFMRILSIVRPDTIQKLKNSIANICSPNTTGEIESSRAKMSFLCEYREELLHNAENFSTGSEIQDEILEDVMAADLNLALQHVDFIVWISLYPLRPDILHLIYLMETQLDSALKDILFDDILSELGYERIVEFNWSQGTYQMDIQPVGNAKSPNK